MRAPELNEGSLKHKTSTVRKTPGSPAVLLEQHEEWQYGERRYLSETSLRHLTHTLHHDQHALPNHNTITLNP